MFFGSLYNESNKFRDCSECPIEKRVENCQCEIIFQIRFVLDFKVSAVYIGLFWLFFSSFLYNGVFHSFLVSFPKDVSLHKEGPKKCSIQYPFEPFWLTMTSQTESFNCLKHTPLYKNEENEEGNKPQFLAWLELAWIPKLSHMLTPI